MRLRVLIVSAIIILTLQGCSTTGRDIQQHLDMDLASQPVVLVDEWVKRMPPMVQVHPRQKVERPFSVLMVPFRVTQKMAYADELGYSVSAALWQNWLADKTFSSLEFARDSGPYRRDLALALGRERGADLVVGGFVTHYFAGGTNADSSVALIMEIYDVHSGQMIWSISQSGMIPKQTTNDFLIFATRTRLPADPNNAIISTLAQDMSKLLKEWQKHSLPADRTLFSNEKPFTGGQRNSQPVYENNNPAPTSRSRSNTAF